MNEVMFIIFSIVWLFVSLQIIHYYSEQINNTSLFKSMLAGVIIFLTTPAMAIEFLTKVILYAFIFEDEDEGESDDNKEQ